VNGRGGNENGVISASGTRTVPHPPQEVWRALAVLRPYCAVCDVSYVVPGAAAAPGPGTTFVCVPGRVADGAVPDTAPRGEILDWEPPRRVTTRLTLGGDTRATETWTTRIELAGAEGGTAVALTIDHRPAAGSGLVARVQRRATQRMVQRMVDDELAKLPDHIAAAPGE
jgi:uncharacterized protein YndB with AHSA1/START domain